MILNNLIYILDLIFTFHLLYLLLMTREYYIHKIIKHENDNNYFFPFSLNSEYTVLTDTIFSF